MIKELYEKPEAKPVIFDMNEVYMLQLWSKSDGEENFFPDDDDENDGWNF